MCSISFQTCTEIIGIHKAPIYVMRYIYLFYLFGVLRCFQHCTGHIMTGSWKGRGNQYIQFVRVLYCKLLTSGKQLPAFPLEESNPGLRGGRRECYHSATVAPVMRYKLDANVKASTCRSTLCKLKLQYLNLKCSLIENKFEQGYHSW